MGAVISVVLLMPALVVFALERHIASKQSLQITGRSLPLIVKPRPARDWACFAFCALVVAMFGVVLAMAQFAALVKFWPYNLALTLANYTFDMEGVGWENFWNSLKMATWVATLGTAVIFVGAYLVEKPRFEAPQRNFMQFAILLLMVVPGLVLSLAYLMFITQPGNS